MGSVVQVEFAAREAEPDHAGQAMMSLRLARRLSRLTPEQWAQELQPRVTYGTVSAAAALCYEAGENVPGADYFLAGLARAGFPIHQLLSLWLDDQTRELVSGVIASLVAS